MADLRVIHDQQPVTGQEAMDAIGELLVDLMPRVRPDDPHYCALAALASVTGAFRPRLKPVA